MPSDPRVRVEPDKPATEQPVPLTWQQTVICVAFLLWLYGVIRLFFH